MIVKASEAERFASHPPKSLNAALVFGPDEGLVRERAGKLARTVVEDLNDPFRVAELDDDHLSADPSRLFDEAAAISMLGGRRAVRVRGAGNGHAKLFEKFLAEHDGDTLVVVEGGDLNKGSALRRVFEAADKAAAIPCYADSARDLNEIVRSALKAEGFTIEGDALNDAVARLGSDRGITRRELEKLALYAQGAMSITAADVQAVMGDESELEVGEALDAAGEGEGSRLDRALARAWAAGISPVAVLRQALTHFQRLLLLRAEVDEGGALFGAVKKLRPPVHFSREKSVMKQAERWTRPRLEAALGELYEGEALVKTTSIPGETACSNALFTVCLMVAGKAR